MIHDDKLYSVGSMNKAMQESSFEIDGGKNVESYWCNAKDCTNVLLRK